MKPPIFLFSPAIYNPVLAICYFPLPLLPLCCFSLTLSNLLSPFFLFSLKTSTAFSSFLYCSYIDCQTFFTLHLYSLPPDVLREQQVSLYFTTFALPILVSQCLVQIVTPGCEIHKRPMACVRSETAKQSTLWLHMQFPDKLLWVLFYVVLCIFCLYLYCHCQKWQKCPLKHLRNRYINNVHMEMELTISFK